MIYLDHNATNLVDPRLRAAYLRGLEEGWANPSSPHGPGRRARALVEESRERVAAVCGVAPAQVTFCASGSEALNQALQSAAPGHSGRGLWRGRPARVVASAVEHPAVLTPLRARPELELALCPVSAAGQLDLAAWEALLAGGAALAALIAAQNEVGTLQPVSEAGAACAARGVPLLLDAVQALGRVAWDWPALPWDYLVLSGHKLRAPRGAAALVHRGRAPEPRPLILGGGQELGRRAGTEHVAAIVALGAACELLARGALFEPDALRARREAFEAALLERVPGAEVMARAAERLPQTTMLLVPGADAEALLVALDLLGVAASTGSACSSGALTASHVLTAMGVSPERARGRLRLSFGPETSPEELLRAAEAVAQAARASRNGE